MMLGQAAGTAAALAQKDKTTVQRVNMAELQERLGMTAVQFKRP
jgi:hypothetical protein